MRISSHNSAIRASIKFDGEFLRENRPSGRWDYLLQFFLSQSGFLLPQPSCNDEQFLHLHGSLAITPAQVKNNANVTDKACVVFLITYSLFLVCKTL